MKKTDHSVKIELRKARTAGQQDDIIDREVVYFLDHVEAAKFLGMIRELAGIKPQPVK